MTPVATSPELVGDARSLLDRADVVFGALLDHVGRRVIGGRSLASRQTVAHRLADHWVGLRAARLAVDDPGVGEDALATWLGAVRAAASLADDALRLHGADGYLIASEASQLRDQMFESRTRHGLPSDLFANVGSASMPMLDRGTASRRALVEQLGDTWGDEQDRRAMRTGALHDMATHRRVAQAGWLGAFMPHAGLNPDLAPTDAFALAEALTVEGVPIYGLNTAAIAAAVIRDHGTEHLRQTVLPGLLEGSALCAIGYTEPGAGSDLAAIATRATRVDGGWQLDGVKRHCTLADVARSALVLARTTGDSGHRGMTLFVVPLDAAGITIEMLPTHGGESTTQMTLDGVIVDEQCIVGDVDRGWSAVMSALRYERNASAWCDAVRLIESGRTLAASAPAERRREWHAALGEAYSDLVLGRALVDVLLEDRADLGQMAAMAVKLFTTERTRAAADAFAVLVQPDERELLAAQRVRQTWRRAISLTIAGGASEVLRDVIAKTALQLPVS